MMRLLLVVAGIGTKSIEERVWRGEGLSTRATQQLAKQSNLRLDTFGQLEAMAGQPCCNRRVLDQVGKAET